MRDLYGYRHLIPTHQGRGAEHLLARVLVEPGRIVPSNLYFTTSREHVTLAGGTWVDVAIPEASEPESDHPFKGNIDLDRLDAVLTDSVPGEVAFVRQEACLNMAGGQPFSLENLRAVRELTRQHSVLFILDATRISENALFVKEREPGHAGQAAAGDHPRDRVALRRRRLLVEEGPLRPDRRHALPERRRRRPAGPRAARRLRGLPPLRRHGRARHGGARAGHPRVLGRADRRRVRGAGPLPRPPARGAGRPDRRARRRACRVPRREAVPPAPPAGSVPGAVARRSALPRGRGAVDGAWHRLGPARRRALRRPRARPADVAAARVRPGAPRLRRGHRRRRARASGTRCRASG